MIPTELKLFIYLQVLVALAAFNSECAHEMLHFNFTEYKWDVKNIARCEFVANVALSVLPIVFGFVFEVVGQYNALTISLLLNASSLLIFFLHYENTYLICGLLKSLPSILYLNLTWLVAKGFVGEFDIPLLVSNVMMSQLGGLVAMLMVQLEINLEILLLISSCLSCIFVIVAMNSGDVLGKDVRQPIIFNIEYLKHFVTANFKFFVFGCIAVMVIGPLKILFEKRCNYLLTNPNRNLVWALYQCYLAVGRIIVMLVLRITTTSLGVLVDAGIIFSAVCLFTFEDSNVNAVTLAVTGVTVEYLRINAIMDVGKKLQGIYVGVALGVLRATYYIVVIMSKMFVELRRDESEFSLSVITFVVGALDSFCNNYVYVNK